MEQRGPERTGRSIFTSFRCYDDPMQVASGPINYPVIHFEAPPSASVWDEMNQFIDWFSKTTPGAKDGLPALTRAGISHLYFVCIHPFEDGNGRIGRAIAEKSLSDCVGQPSLIALAQSIHKNRKSYYNALERNNKDLDITDWLLFFAHIILSAQEYSLKTIEFLLKKTKLYDCIRNKLNDRQEKAIERMFQEGIEGFKGG